MSLMEQIRAFAVPERGVAIWWLGQNGFVFKSPEGTLAGVDLYLTDSCAALSRQYGIDLSRRVPILVPPEELAVDIFACTHNHQDHTDPDTIRRLPNKDTASFVGPPPSCGVFRQQGVEPPRITMSWPDCEIGFAGVTLHGTFALPTDATDLNHMGFVLRFGDGPAVYVTGDTDDTELLGAAARHKPDILICCINGGFNNLSAWEAAGLAARIAPRMAIPCHYDMFPDNSADPGQFRAGLNVRAPGVAYQELRHGEPFVFSI